MRDERVRGVEEGVEGRADRTVEHLRVTEQEHHGLVVDARLHHDFLDVFAPLGHAIVLGQLDLEALVLRPARKQPRKRQ